MKKTIKIKVTYENLTEKVKEDFNKLLARGKWNEADSLWNGNGLHDGMAWGIDRKASILKRTGDRNDYRPLFMVRGEKRCTQAQHS